MKGKLIGLGVGPGDPELLTLKGIKLIQEAEVLIAPCSKIGESTAYQIIKDYIKGDTQVLEMVFPMVYCKETLTSAWEENVQQIINFLDTGVDVVFLTLGDPMVYSTFIYMMERMKDLKYAIESIPGITSFCAVANRTLIPLAEGEEAFTVLPLKRNSRALEKAIETGNNLVVLKASSSPAELGEILKKNHLEYEFVMCSNCGKGNEQVTTKVEDLKKGEVPYFSTVIIKNKGNRGGI